MLTWNIEGFSSKLDDTDFKKYLETLSFVCLCETFLEQFENTFLPDYTCYVSPALKLSRYGRSSGGVICFIKQELSKYFTLIKSPLPNTLIFIVHNNIFNCDILLIVTYIPPMGSAFNGKKKCSDGVIMLENLILDLLEVHDCNIIRCGDLNSRTGRLNT